MTRLALIPPQVDFTFNPVTALHQFKAPCKAVKIAPKPKLGKLEAAKACKSKQAPVNPGKPPQTLINVSFPTRARLWPFNHRPGLT